MGKRGNQNKKRREAELWGEEKPKQVQATGSSSHDKSDKIQEDRLRIAEDKTRVLEDLLMKIGSSLRSFQLNVEKSSDGSFTNIYEKLIEDLTEIKLVKESSEDISKYFARGYLKKYTKDNCKSKKQLKQEAQSLDFVIID